jgi:hypothetical protein
MEIRRIATLLAFVLLCGAAHAFPTRPDDVV